ncbi:MAG: choice-of-anchor D domain-containing protein [Bryobacteraceae bacterium]
MPALAQTPVFPFQLRIQQDTNVATIPNNANVTVFADNIKGQTSLRVTATYRGTTSVTINQAPDLFGSPDFQIASFPPVPIKLNPADSFNFEIRFTASSSLSVTAQLNITYSETPSTGLIPVAGLIVVNLTGSAPEFSVNYVLQADSNVLPLAPNGTIAFPPTLVNTTSLAAVIVLNRGSGPGTVKSVALTGDAFQLLGLPLLPTVVDSGRDVRFTIRYSPKKIAEDTGTLRVGVGDQTLSFTLKGSATGSFFSYEVLQEDQVLAVAPDESFAIPETPVGQSTSVAVRVRNSGNGDGVVNSINLIGPGYVLADVPLLPRVLTPNTSLLFTVTFAPSQAGPAKARLRIGNDSFEISSSGIGSRLTYSYGNATSIPVTAGGGIVFSPVSVGQTGRLTVKVKNTGTAPAPISNIGVVDAKSAFDAIELPEFPLSLEPDKELQFVLTFKPLTTGFNSATLRIDTVPFLVSGSGNPPPPLPAYTFDAPASIGTLEQPALRLLLNEPYPLALTGALTMTVNAEPFQSDNSVQFFTGGRVVTFSIPANSREATFPTGANSIRMQTGSVASLLTFTPSFSTATASLPGVDLTPADPRKLTMRIAGGPPKLSSVQVASRTQTGLILQITGISPSLDLSRIDVEFKAGAGVTIPTLKFGVDVATAAATWFRTAQAQGQGSQFTLQLPFTFRSDSTVTGSSGSDAVKAATVTAVSPQGSSAPVNVDIQ